MTRIIQAEIRDDACLYDARGSMVAGATGFEFIDVEVDRTLPVESVALLASSGVTADEIIKLKACGVI